MIDKIVIIRKRKEIEKRVFSILIKTEIIDKLDKLSTESGLSRNALIEEILCYGVDNIQFEFE